MSKGMWVMTATNWLTVQVAGEALTHARMGQWITKRYRRLAIQNGTQRAAQRMRKDGCPLSLALAVLAGRT